MNHSRPGPRRFQRNWSGARQSDAQSDSPACRRRAEASNGKLQSFPIIGSMLAWLAPLLNPRPVRFAQKPAASFVDDKVRLQTVAVKLEALLDELDDLGFQRIAIDVCMALERVQAKLAESDGRS